MGKTFEADGEGAIPMATLKKFRSTGHDIAPAPPKKPSTKPGTPGENKIPVYDSQLRRRGHVGHLASSATVARLTGQHGSKIQKVDGRDAWVSPEKGDGGRPDARHAQNLRSAKGSVTHSPSAPAPARRPKR